MEGGRLSVEHLTCRYFVIDDDDDEVLVTDNGNHRVVSWRLSDGGGLRVVCGGVQGPGPGQLDGPWGAAASGDGALWVTDAGNNRLSLFH